MTRGRSRGVLALLAVLPWLMHLTACARAVDGEPRPSPAAVTLPASAEDLEELVVAEVPSGLPRLPDADLDPPAGAKRLEDIAHYADDPARELEVLREFGYRHGWERFWGSGSGPMTGVFVDQFESRAGAGAYAEDLARNDAEHYDGVLHSNPPGLPGGCRMLTVDGGPELSGPTAFVWCSHGVFSVSVTAVAESKDAAEEEVRAVLFEQLDRLPPG
ncbi:MAG TPA: hypothetical protein VK402_00555 [Blastococcus sp.]|nr:hypothetical protein [Blastococcus sp.]